MEKIHFYNKGKQKLVGLLDKRGDKCVIISHGFASNKESMSVFSKFLAENNYTTLTFDYSGNGESDGNIEETSVKKWTEDLEAAINFMQNYDSIGLLGNSLGAMTSLILSDKAKATVALAPPSHFRRLEKYFRDKELLKDIGEYIVFGGFKIKKAFVEESDYDMAKIMKNVHQPVLIIHGDSDEIVPVSQSKEVINYINEPKKLLIVPGLTHQIQTIEQIKIVQKEVLEWLKKYL